VQIKNRPFVRNIIICHANNVEDANAFLASVGFGKPYSVRVSCQNNTEVHTIPRRLLSLSAEDVHVLGAHKSNLHKHGTVSVPTDVSTSVKDWSSIASYVMSVSILKTWGFPVPCDADPSTLAPGEISAALDMTDIQLTSAAANVLDGKRSAHDMPAGPHSPMKRIRSNTEPPMLETVSVNKNVRGVRVGFASMPGLSESEKTSLTYQTVACGQQLLENFVCTLNKTSAEFSRLWGSMSVEASSSSVTAEPESVICVDCEMCETAAGMELTRLTLVDAHSRVILDTLVLPENPITDYKTQWSGITASMLEDVTVCFKQAQIAFLRLVSAETILIGHSLDSDLKALKICHLNCVDTAMLFPHPQGFPYRRKLKVLAENYLKVQIQKSGPGHPKKSGAHGSQQGHDSVEDARAAMRLVNLKVEKGPSYGVKGSVSSEDEFRQPLTAFADQQELCLLSGSLFMWTTLEHERIMRPCVGEDGLGVVVKHDVELCTSLMCKYLSKHTNRISKSLLADIAAVPTYAAIAGRAIAVDPAAGTELISENVSMGNDTEEEVEEVMVSRDDIVQHEMDVERLKDDVLAKSALGQLGLSGIKLCYFEFDASQHDNSARVLREMILRLQTQLVEETPSFTISSEPISATGKSPECCSSASVTPPQCADVHTEDEVGHSRPMAVGNTLLVLTTSANSELASALAKRKLACQNVRSTAMWTKELEEQLRAAFGKSNIAHVSFKIL
jgi:DNA polymerase III epsilon subunit-like protein